MSGGLLHSVRFVPNGDSCPGRRDTAIGAVFPSPKVTLPGPRNLLHQTTTREPDERRGTTSAAAMSRALGAAVTVGLSCAISEMRTVMSGPATTLGGSVSPTSSE